MRHFAQPRERRTNDGRELSVCAEIEKLVIDADCTAVHRSWNGLDVRRVLLRLRLLCSVIPRCPLPLFAPSKLFVGVSVLSQLTALFLISLHVDTEPTQTGIFCRDLSCHTNSTKKTAYSNEGMSGERSDSSSGGPSASVAAGCSLSESSRARPAFGGGSGAGSGSAGSGSAGEAGSGSAQTAGLSSSFMGRGSGAGGGLAVFSWGRGEDGQLGIGDTR